MIFARSALPLNRWFVCFQLKQVLAESERQLSVAMMEAQKHREELSQVGFPLKSKHLQRAYTHYPFIHNPVPDMRLCQKKAVGFFE